jgi:hypothetical protein
LFPDVGVALAVLLTVVAMYTLVEFLVRRDARRIATGEQQNGVVLGDTFIILGRPCKRLHWMTAAPQIRDIR